MVDKRFSMSSFLALRYIEKAGIDFAANIPYRHPRQPEDENRVLVHTADDIGYMIEKQLKQMANRYRKIGIMLSGGMDSAILASYLPGCDAYTFRFLDGEYQKQELQRAETYAAYYGLTLHYVAVNWDMVVDNLRPVMISKGGPVHAIEPQIYQGAKQAIGDGVDLVVVGDGSDYIFGGMDQLLSKDWTFEAFMERYIYVDPFEVLNEPVSVRYLFERYRKGDHIDFLGFIDTVATMESYASYENAFLASGVDYFDPYVKLKMADPMDLERIRSGDSKYLIRELFKIRYPDLPVPDKVPMPRPVDLYFANWEGPTRAEFRKGIDIRRYNGNQKWLIWCLEQFLNMVDEGVAGYTHER